MAMSRTAKTSTMMMMVDFPPSFPLIPLPMDSRSMSSLEDRMARLTSRPTMPAARAKPRNDRTDPMYVAYVMSTMKMMSEITTKNPKNGAR